MKNIDQLLAFVKVAEEQSFSRTAKILKISTARVSRQIADLEKALGVALFKRTTRQVNLTELGEKYYQQIKEVLRGLEEAENLLASAQTEPQGQLSILTNPFMNQTYLLPHLAKFLAKYPKLKLKLIVAESALDLPPEHIDVCYGTTLEGPSNWVRKVLFKTHYGLYAAPKYLKKMGHPLTPQALKNYHFITHMHRPEVLGLELGGQKITLSAYLLTNDCTSMLHAVMQGLGFAMLLECFVREEVAEGKLVEILPEYLNKTLRPLSLYYPSARYLQPKVRAFVDFFANIEFNKNLT